MKSMYRHSIATLVKSLTWDLNPANIRHRSRITGLHQSRAGGKAVILCNGPSLNAVDFDLLAAAGVATFGLNKINLLFDRTAFRPDYIVAVNRHVLDQNLPFYSETGITCFLDRVCKPAAFANPNAIRINANSHKGFSFHCDRYVCQGNTVTFVAMQLALYLGFRDVALVGCDHNFGTVAGRNKKEFKAGDDVHHFSKDYFRDVVWGTPDIVESECSYLRARAAFEENGGRIVNCTEGGKLEIFERMPLEAFLSGS